MASGSSQARGHPETTSAAAPGLPGHPEAFVQRLRVPAARGRGSRRPRLGLACYPNQVSRRERLPVPPARISRAAAPASEHTCGPAPAPFVSRFLKSIRGTASVSRWQSAGAGSCALSGIARAGARGGEAPRTIPAGPRCWGHPGKRAGSASPNHPGNPGGGEGGQSGAGGER